MRINVACDSLGAPVVSAEDGRTLPVRARYGHVWTSLGSPTKELFDIPEADQPAAALSMWAVVRVKCSPLRAVENFLDIDHFPFVHSDILGASPTPKSSATRCRSARRWTRSGRPR